MSLNLNLSKPLAIVGVVVSAIVVLALLAAFLPSLFSSTTSITENITTGDVGNAQATSILHIFGFIVPVVIVLAIVGLIIGGVALGKK